MVTMNEKVSITVFSGGRGTKSIQEALSGLKNVEVTYLINGYDSGLSTGEVRKSISGLLGPSDFRKAFTNLAAWSNNDRQMNIARILDHRLPMDLKKAQQVLFSWQSLHGVLETFRTVSPKIDLDSAIKLAETLLNFVSYLKRSDHLGSFDCSDLAIGNSILAGLFLKHGSLQEGLDELARIFDFKDSVRILDVTQGEDLWLVSIASTDFLCVDEGHFVTNQPPAAIEEYMLIPRELYLQLFGKFSSWARADKSTLERIRNSAVIPNANLEALQAIENSNAVIYGSGTLHSSLLPSYLVSGISGAIQHNKEAMKVLFVNGSRDVDIHESLNIDFTWQATLAALDGQDMPRDFISEIWLTSDSWEGLSAADVQYPSIPVKNLTDPGKHKYSASDSYNALSHAVSMLLGSKLSPSSSVTSVVVPIFNEYGKLEELRRQLSALTKSLSGNSIELILVDGGSNDGTFQEISKWTDVEVLQVKTRRGRQEAIFAGIKRARGTFVGVFHSDGEYDEESFRKLLAEAESQPNALVLGSRTLGVSSEGALRTIYADNKSLYWISRLGGLLISSLLSIRLGRIVSDPLCGIYAGPRDRLLALSHVFGDHDAQISLITASRRAGLTILESGLTYSPRSRNDGKKTNLTMGLRALLSVVLS
jgi:2-phospho-L-lactate transferase/gluconeogenesis factor (CofD/UPF0052 family)